MRSYKLRYFLFGFGLLLLSTMLYLISEKVEQVYPILTKRYQQLFDQKEELEAITIGSSHSVAIDFPTLGYTGYHLWDFAEDLFESSFKTRNVLNQLPNLKIVFLNVPYPIFIHDNAHSILGTRYRNRAKLHYITQQFELIAGDVNAFAKGKFTPISRYDHWVFIIKHLLKDSSEIIPVKETLSIDTLQADGNMRGFTAGFQDEATLKEVAIEKLQEHLKTVKRSKQQVWGIERKTEAALTTIIQNLQSRNIRLVLYTSPFCSAYIDTFPKDIRNSFRASLSKLSEEHKILYYDFSEHEDFVDEPAYFQDGNHLSSAGTIAFSRLLKQVLR